MIKRVNYMVEQVEKILQEWKVPTHYVGYGHLLTAAELYEAGEPFSLVLLCKVAVCRHRRLYRVRMALYTVLKYVNTTPFGRAWAASHGHPMGMEEFFLTLFTLAEQRKQVEEGELE